MELIEMGMHTEGRIKERDSKENKRGKEVQTS